jgi:hypothetical protein
VFATTKDRLRILESRAAQEARADAFGTATSACADARRPAARAQRGSPRIRA